MMWTSSNRFFRADGLVQPFQRFALSFRQRFEPRPADFDAAFRERLVTPFLDRIQLVK